MKATKDLVVFFAAVSGAILFALLGMSSPAQATITTPVGSTFDANLDGWTGNASWASGGGNPGGYAHYPGSIFQPAPTGINAPAKFLGDWSGLNGTGRISFDHRIIDVGEGVNGFYPYFIQLGGPGGGATWTGPTPSAATDWLTFHADLDASNWNVTSGTWAGLLNNVTSFHIRLEVVGNSVAADEDGIDNVWLTTIPEPGGLTLLALGGLALALRRQNRGR